MAILSDYGRSKIAQFKTFFLLLAEIGAEIRSHPFVSATLALCALAYGAAYWTAVIHPQAPIQEYFEAFNDRNADSLRQAWDQLAPSYREKRWGGNFDEWSKGYATTVAGSTPTIEYEADERSPLAVWKALTSNTLTYNVTFSVTDSFTHDDFSKDAAAYDLLWVEAAYPNESLELRNGTLSSPNIPGHATLEITRIYKKRVTVMKGPARRWQITGITTEEIALKMPAPPE